MSLQSASMERTDNEIKEPKQYIVVMLNDDFTTMEFVVRILVEIFRKDVHRSGQAVVGKYPYDIAATRVKRALSLAKAEGFPFRMFIEEA